MAAPAVYVLPGQQGFGEVPAGQQAPFAVVTETDHRAWIIVATALCLSCILLASVARVSMRYYGELGWDLDDSILTGSTIMSFAQTALVLAATPYGLGQSIHVRSQRSVEKAEQLYYASNILYVLSVGASRVATIVFLRRLTPVAKHKRAIDMFAGAVGVFTIGVALAVSLQCNLSQPWLLLPGTCATGWFIRWEVGEIVGALSELIIVGITVWTLVWSLQRPSRKKVEVVMTFGLRLIILIPIGLRLSDFHSKSYDKDPTLSLARFICWTQTEMVVSIVAASMPLARVLFANLITNYGGIGGMTLADTAYIHSSGKQETSDGIPLSRIGKSVKQGLFLSSKKNDSRAEASYNASCSRRSHDMTRPARVSHQARPADGNENHETNSVDAPSIGTVGSQEMIIRRDRTYTVEYGK